ncbi:hypothetical protein F5148DRAFT_191774 [Russula earlei]|uniref:Uncharacterized protein n=1 Tax=Russula earlei TaxID=71964 RepID=A0ACC0U6I0_9AGAM|nr:hypothetical protein F5148DRAFT_191774 [Russula earlei]
MRHSLLATVDRFPSLIFTGNEVLLYCACGWGLGPPRIHQFMMRGYMNLTQWWKPRAEPSSFSYRAASLSFSRHPLHLENPTPQKTFQNKPISEGVQKPTKRPLPACCYICFLHKETTSRSVFAAVAYQPFCFWIQGDRNVSYFDLCVACQEFLLNQNPNGSKKVKTFIQGPRSA